MQSWPRRVAPLNKAYLQLAGEQRPPNVAASARRMLARVPSGGAGSLSLGPLEGGNVRNITQRSFTSTLPMTPEQSTLSSGRS
jgi:hypothetical protein